MLLQKYEGQDSGVVGTLLKKIEKKSTETNFLGPETARWGGGLPGRKVRALPRKFVLLVAVACCSMHLCRRVSAQTCGMNRSFFPEDSVTRSFCHLDFVKEVPR